MGSKDIVFVVSIVLSVVNLVLVFGMFQSSLDLLHQQVEYDRQLLLELQAKVNVSIRIITYKHDYDCKHFVYKNNLNPF